jgi:hypothetical protein
VAGSAANDVSVGIVPREGKIEAPFVIAAAVGKQASVVVYAERGAWAITVKSPQEKISARSGAARRRIRKRILTSEAFKFFLARFILLIRRCA